ncbi:conserved hypothetical protein [Theileria orientalis strain Shintoku]|uniref:Uncharacterized protein n=1 Tax=Theileria orientalis strain Shintoku TaxID=869250 RepID=J4C3Z7_THEOR|nr:conserved hypothetical protein [Theileria orientalis strain Shintoku]BAM41306.1 conserved hypothetical protein [Theileria orientalis strain Shintoku]|eukprot:XP_009691607.1 conserved hypothetical protein [Theileria orientalis strain Shintoku]
MWRSVNASFSKYSIELAQLLCRCLKDPFKEKALARYKLNLKQTNYANGIPQAPAHNLICVQNIIKNSSSRDYWATIPNNRN